MATTGNGGQVDPAPLNANRREQRRHKQWENLVVHEPDNERNLAEQLASTNMERHRRIGVMFSSELDVEGGDLKH